MQAYVLYNYTHSITRLAHTLALLGQERKTKLTSYILQVLLDGTFRPGT